MAAIKNIFKFTINNVSMISGVIPKNQLYSINANLARKTYFNTQIRCVTFYPLAKNIQYISNTENLKISVDPQTMKLNMKIDKPLCYMFTWLYAKNPHVIKYAKIYLDRGFDICNVKCDPIHIMFPKVGAQPVVKNFMKFLEQNTHYNPIVFQGFSVASYMWGEFCKYASQDLPRYQPLIDRIVCQTWDSMPDVTEFKVGVSTALFPYNPMYQKMLYYFIAFHLWFFKNTSTIHYYKSSEHLHKNLLKAPCLLLCSDTDPVGNINSIRKYRESWENIGIKTSWKCFENSPHVQHIHTYPEEYVKTVVEHLKANVPFVKELENSK